MKKFILNLTRDRAAYLFVLLGAILVIFPNQVAAAVPYILGIGTLIYAVLTIVISLKYPNPCTSLGNGITKAVMGFVILFLKDSSISILGVIWAMQSLEEVAEEIDEYRKTKTISAVSIISMIISTGLAALLLMDPFEHFTMHVRILGLEMIASAFIRRRAGGKS